MVPLKPSFVLFPLMAQGHTIPMIDMAKLLAKHGVDVTIIVTPLQASRFSDTICRVVAAGHSIRLHPIRFPAEEVGLPPGCESAECIPSFDDFNKFSKAIWMLQGSVEETLQAINPSCVISDKNITFMVEICAKLNIPRVIFDGMSCFAELIMLRLHFSMDHETVPMIQPFPVPGLPDKIEFTRSQLPGMLNPGPEGAEAHKMVAETELQAYGIVVNSFEELETKYVDELRQARGGKLWVVGPLSLNSRGSEDMAQRGGKSNIDAQKCLKWLDSMDSGSVIYASMGSLSRVPLCQLIELTSALESCSYPFILVAKEGFVDDGLEERTRGKGLIIRGWAPQMLILSHPSVGGFLTHCGWNSTLEGISAGVPMITWPLFAEQFLNEKLVQVLRIGVGVGAKKVAHLGREQDPDNLVTRDAIMTAIHNVFDKGDEGVERRKRAQKYAAIAKRSIGEGGSSYLNITSLIQEFAPLEQT